MADPLLKRAELWVRRQLLRRWNGAAPCTITAPQLSVAVDEGTRILFLRQDRIGDVLVSIPVLRILRSAFPNAELGIVLGPNNWEARHAVEPYVTRCWRYDKRPLAVARLFRRLRQYGYSIAVDLMDNPSVTSTLFLQLLNAPIRIGIAKGNDRAYTHVVPLLDTSRYHIVERIAQLLLPFGIDPTQQDLHLEYPLSASDRQWARSVLGERRRAYRVGIVIAASHPSKYWGTERWICFLRMLQERHPEAEVLLFASPTYEREQHAIAQATEARRVPIVPSFHQFAALLEQCDVIVTPDTAAVHLAAAWQRPCVALYVWDRPELLPWFPYGSPYEAVFTRTSPLERIPAEEVMTAFSRLVQRVSLPTSPR
ncbi:MAG: glycosyltransferase family 9 protein [Candidatus Kapabacteria bacterium]|nr:glycosyltransferase family 9 protein [Candidatus Kapabacteria bacterium]MDW8012832.1 glycosyltransferase family 9 protein [Bacteroidota bacterium]